MYHKLAVFSLCLLLLGVPFVAEAIPNRLSLDNVDVYDIKTASKSYTCARVKNTSAKLVPGSIDGADFLPLNVNIKQLKRRLRAANGTKKRRITRKIETLQRSVTLCRQARGAKLRVFQSFACDFRLEFEDCSKNGECKDFNDGGIAGEGLTVSAAYADALAGCQGEITLMQQALAAVITPISGKYINIRADQGCIFKGCNVVPDGFAWNTYQCIAVGAVVECDRGNCVETVGGSDGAVLIGREIAEIAAAQSCNNTLQGIINNIEVQTGNLASVSRSCFPSECNRFVGYKSL